MNRSLLASFWVLSLLFVLPACDVGDDDDATDDDDTSSDDDDSSGDDDDSSGDDDDSSPTEEAIDVLGQHLAGWSDYNHQMLSINGLRLNSAGPNAGGYSEIFWDNPIHAEHLEEHRANLAQLILESTCEPAEVSASIMAVLLDFDEAQLQGALNCLGQIALEEAEWGCD